MTTKVISLLFTLITILAAMIVPSPNGPPPEPSVAIQVINTPDDAMSIDVLYQPHIVNFDHLNTHRPELLESELVGYQDDGYISFSLYYQAADTHTYRKDRSTHFFQVRNYDPAIFNNIRVVSLNQSGHILKVSDPIDISKERFYTYGNPGITYDFGSNHAKVNYKTASLWNIVFYSLVYGAGRIFFSVLIEVLIGLLAKFRPIWIVIVANLITQGIITGGLPFLSHSTSYVFAVVVFEIAVVAIEYAIYNMSIKSIDKKKLLIFAVGANLASLFIILPLNLFGVFTG